MAGPDGGTSVGGGIGETGVRRSGWDYLLADAERRVRALGNLLAALCVAWMAIVGVLMAGELTPRVLENHRDPAIEKQVKACEGAYASKFVCAQTILLTGERMGALEVLLRVIAVIALPCIAWAVWRFVMRRIRYILWESMVIPRLRSRDFYHP
jgi:hypothetical protein